MIEAEKIAGMVTKAMDESIRERGQLNIVIAGRTGVGKSTLINAVFQGDFANTGQGRPVTSSTKEITKKDIPLTIFDTRGLEMAAYEETIKELENLVVSRSKETDHNKHIHVAWLCIQEGSRRVEDAEIMLHNTLAQHMPVIGLITQPRADQGFKAEVQRLLPQTRNVTRVRALAEESDDGHVLAPMGLEELVELTSEVIPEAHQRAFAAAQKASVKKKKNVAHGIVGSSAAVAGTLAANPIPFTDALVIVPCQVGMLAGISSIFGLKLSTAFLSTLIASIVGTSAATFSGKLIVSGLLKLIPIGNLIVGPVISAAIAVTLTKGLGEIYIATLVALFSDSGGEPPSSEDVEREFKKRLGKKSAEQGDTPDGNSAALHLLP